MRAWILLCGVVPLSACGGSEEEGEAGRSAGGASEKDEAEADSKADLAAMFGVEGSAVTSLEACAEGHAEADLAASAKLAYDTDASIHELIACGGLTVRVAFGLVTGVVGMVLEDEDAMPAGIRYQGSGVYLSESRMGESSMQMRVRLYEETGQGFALIEDDLFDADNYLSGVSVDADASADVDVDLSNPLNSNLNADASVSIEYEAAGSWVKLLGLGDPPPNPIDIANVAEIEPDFGNIYIQSEVDLHDVRGDSDVHYVVRTEMVGVTELFTSGGMAYEVASLEASNATLEQTLEMDSWEVEYGDGNRLDGSVEFLVESFGEASVGYRAVLVYRNASYGEVQLACAD